ncbi:MAG: pyrroline-5-carboxylate reductase [Defluviitaleaceae bacterium]|nr:pyrroline-5-carboxylate reductase [Defluviitaleaceae bacterium]
MATALISGIIKATGATGATGAENIIASDTNPQRLTFLAEKFGVTAAKSNSEVAEVADILFLSIKPHIYEAVLSEILIKPNALVVIIAPGFTIADIQKLYGAGHPLKIIKSMPNTPAMVNCGMTAVCAGENVTSGELTRVLNIFNAVGKTEILPERLFDAFTAIAGSSPAYAYTFIEALADAGVKYGLSRAQAIKISAQALFGAAKMVLETDEHPAILRDAVCSPGGTTIAAVSALERTGFRHAVISAADAVVEKNKGKG